MGIGEAGAVNGDKPRAHTDNNSSAGSAMQFNDALGRSSSSAPTTHAERRTQFVQDDLNQVDGENLKPQERMGEHLVKAGASKEDFVLAEIHATAPAGCDLKFVEAAHDGQSSHVPSFAEFNKELAAPVAYNGLNPPSPFEQAKWTDDATAATQAWDKDVFGVFGQHGKTLNNETAAPRLVGEVAPMAWNSIFEGIGLPAALGTGGAFMATGGEALALRTVLESSTGISTSAWLGRFAEFGPGVSFGTNLFNRGNEGIGVRSYPVSVVSAAATDPFGGMVVETITRKSNLTGEDINLSTGERAMGGVFDLVEGRMNITGARAFAEAPDVEELPFPLRTELAGNDTPTSTPAPLSIGSTVADDIAANSGSTEDSRPSDVTSSSTAEIASYIPDRGDPINVRNAAGADAPKLQSSAFSAAEAGADRPLPTISIDQIVEAYLRRRSSIEIGNSVGDDDITRELERFRGGRRKDEDEPEIAEGHGDDRYGGRGLDDLYRPYSQPAIGKSEPTVTAAQLKDQLKQYEGLTESPDGWDFRTTTRSSPITPADQLWLNPNQTNPVDPASGGAGADSNGSEEDRREQRRYRRPGERRSQPSDT